MPSIAIISGPNGAGKSTLAPELLRDTLGITEYVNADTIAEGLSAFAPQRAAFEAGRVMLHRLRTLGDERMDFALETTLASKTYPQWLKDLKTTGYRVGLIFLWLDSPDLAVERVRARVKAGGHDIPEDTIIRRYHRGIINLHELYLPLADTWQIYDASRNVPQIVAQGSEDHQLEIVDADSWKKIVAAQKNRRTF
jgi:predicted ABC-type ATPase